MNSETQVPALFVQPHTRELRRVKLDLPFVPNALRDLLMPAACQEGTREQDMLAAGIFLKHTCPLEVGAYTIWQDDAGRHVLMVGDKKDHRDGFRLGKRTGEIFGAL